MGRASALAFAREGAFVDDFDRSVDQAQATLELVRDGPDGRSFAGWAGAAGPRTWRTAPRSSPRTRART